MKKLLLILLCLPLIGFGQDCNPNELIGFYCEYKTDFYEMRMELNSNGTVTKKRSTADGKHILMVSSGKWWVELENNVLHMEMLYKWGGDCITDCSWYYTLVLNSNPLIFHSGGRNNTIKYKYTVREYNNNLLSRYLNNFQMIRIKFYVEDKIKEWQQKGEFEKTVAFQKRVNENTRKYMLEKYQKEAIEHFKKEAITSVNYKDITLKRYNPDLETFLINISGYGSFNLPVPISKAPSFKKKFNASNFSNLDLILEDDKFIVSYFEIDGYSYDISGNGIYNKCIGDCQNGYGTYTAKEGTYKGDWKDGSVHGKGIFEGNEYTYNGEYVNGKQHGQGKKTYTNGTIEEGLFENGEFVGE